MKIFDSTLSSLERSLDARLQRQNVLAGNLANADTPRFQPKDVDLEKAMELSAQPSPESTGVTQAGHLPLETSLAVSSNGAVIAAPGTEAGLDGNQVDVDKTLVNLAENALQYGASAKAAQKKLAILRYVASDGAA